VYGISRHSEMCRAQNARAGAAAGCAEAAGAIADPD